MFAQSDIDTLLEDVRARDLSASIRSFGTFAFGRECAVVNGGIGFRGIGSDVALVNGQGQPLSGTADVLGDHGLAAFGLEAVMVPDHGVDLTWRAQVGALVFRAGLLLRILDASYAHLSGRVSGGQKTLQHQLVKAAFTECFSLAEMVRLEAAELGALAHPTDLGKHHDTLSAATTKAAKLMGGHGFLAGKVNALETLSFSLSSQLGARQKHQLVLAAA